MHVVAEALNIYIQVNYAKDWWNLGLFEWGSDFTALDLNNGY